MARKKTCNMEKLWMCVDSDIFDSTDIMLAIEKRINNGIISSKVQAAKKTFCLPEDLIKLVNTNLQNSHNIFDNINDQTIEQDLATINMKTLNMKSDTENTFNNASYSSLENAIKQNEIMEQNLIV